MIGVRCGCRIVTRLNELQALLHPDEGHLALNNPGLVKSTGMGFESSLGAGKVVSTSIWGNRGPEQGSPCS
jgi:hypothetical protein